MHEVYHYRRVSIRTEMLVTTYVLFCIDTNRILINVCSTSTQFNIKRVTHIYVQYFIIGRPSSLFYVSSSEFHRLNVK